MLDLRRLQCFLAVADAGNMTRAAEQLGIQQPPLTRQIQTLEREVGAALFQRLPRGMRITPAGQALAEEARTILARAAALPDLAQRAARGDQGRIVLGYTSSAAFHPFVTREIRAFRQAWPGVRLDLVEDGTPELVSALREERLDGAFLRAPAPDAAGLIVEPLLEEEMLAVLPTDHPLARAGDDIPLAALATETFVLYRRPAGPGLYDAIIAACHGAGFSPLVGQEAPRMPSMLSLVAAGLGVSVVPASMRQMNVEGVAYLRLSDAPGLKAPLFLATRRGERSPVVARFRRAVRAAVAPQGAARE